jgi:hypothetical protein
MREQARVPPSSHQHPEFHINGKGIPVKIELFRYDMRFFSHATMYDDRRRPANGRPRGGSGTNNFKKNLPAVPRRIPEAGFHRMYYDFHGSGVNHLDSCLLLQNPLICFLKKNISYF